MSQDGAKRRNSLIDAVRALALAGVIMVNMLTISGLAFMTPDMRAEALGTVDQAVWGFLNLFFEGKALAAFSFLFGFSFSLILARAHERGSTCTAMVLRRMAVLGAIGVVNAVFLFWADILMTYAALGLALPLAARLPVRVVAGLGAGLIAAGPVALALGGFDAPQPVPQGLIENLEAYAAPDYAATVGQNVAMIASASEGADSLLVLRFFLLSGLFLLGLAAGRANLLAQIETLRGAMLRAGGVLFAVGLAMKLALYVGPTPTGAGLVLHLDTVLMALGYLMLIAAALQAGAATWLRKLLAPLGRMSLTGYLMSAALGQAVFHGWGLGLIGAVGTLAVLGVALAIYAVLLGFAHLWFRHCLFGPWEWLWRSLSRLRAQPLLRGAPAHG